MLLVTVIILGNKSVANCLGGGGRVGPLLSLDLAVFGSIPAVVKFVVRLRLLYLPKNPFVTSLVTVRDLPSE